MSVGAGCVGVGVGFVNVSENERVGGWVGGWVRGSGRRQVRGDAGREAGVGGWGEGVRE